MPDELVSILIPTYNRKTFLERALASVLKQTHANLDIIVIDDHSSDGTPDLMHSLEQKDSRIRFIRNEKNKGLGFNRDLGIKMARGSFISLLDDDDEWLPNKIEQQLAKARLIKTPALILCSGFDRTRNERFATDPGRSSGFMSFKKNTTPLSYALPSPSHWFFPRSIAEAVGGFDASFACWADSDFLLRLFLKKIPIYYSNELLVTRHRIENEQYLSQVSDRWIRSKELFLQKHYSTIKQDRYFLFRLYYSIAKDYQKIRNKLKARSYFLRALKLKPYKVEILGRLAHCW